MKILLDSIGTLYTLFAVIANNSNLDDLNDNLIK